MKNTRGISPDHAMKLTQKIFKQHGTEALETARKAVREEKIESKQAREALNYFMTKCWRDLARPSLLAIACQAVGGNPDLTTPIAVSLTLMSGAMDIHDDIIDQSEEKYGRQTVYGKYGRDIALLVGDALLLKGLTMLNQAADKEISNEKMQTIMNIIKSMFFELGDAEALELEFRGSLNVSPKVYLRVVRKKAADVEAHTHISAILGGASQEQIQALRQYGRLLGMLILLRDDWIDILDVDESRRRIKKESLPLPILYGLQHPEIKHPLKNILLKENITKKNAESVLKLIQKTDIPRKYRKLMSELVEEAITAIRKQKIKSQELEIIAKAGIP